MLLVLVAFQRKIGHKVRPDCSAEEGIQIYMPTHKADSYVGIRLSSGGFATLKKSDGLHIRYMFAPHAVKETLWR